MEPSYLVTSPDEVYPSVAPHSNEVFNSPAAEPSPDSNMEASSGIKSLVELYPLIELHSSETFNSYVVEPSLDKNVELEHPHRPSSDTEEKTGAGETSKTISRHPPEDKSPEQGKAQSAFQRRRQLMSDLDAITPCNDCDVWPRNDRRCGRLRQVNYDTSSRYLYGDVSSNDHGQGEGLEVIGTLTIECLVPPVHGLIYRNHVTS
ncbi:unnamed protein product [Lymnaea stagnalis]|uniref:Uncharacterized protein n=1 Tax=Lymnaea stagnalis TaxID=6523 RepID=A0AAV2HE88_LYMST